MLRNWLEKDGWEKLMDRVRTVAKLSKKLEKLKERASGFQNFPENWFRGLIKAYFVPKKWIE